MFPAVQMKKWLEGTSDQNIKGKKPGKARSMLVWGIQRAPFGFGFYTIGESMGVSAQFTDQSRIPIF